jgi:hypothetical protein
MELFAFSNRAAKGNVFEKKTRVCFYPQIQHGIYHSICEIQVLTFDDIRAGVNIAPAIPAR